MTAADLTPDVRAELRALEAKATPGPWRAHQDRQHGVLSSVTGVSTNPSIPNPDIVCSMNLSDRYLKDDGHNAAFIVAAKEWLLPLLDALDRADADLAAKREAHETMRREVNRLKSVLSFEKRICKAAAAGADQASAALASAQETIAERDREIAGLREALAPFADEWRECWCPEANAGFNIGDDEPLDSGGGSSLTAGDLRRAAAALDPAHATPAGEGGAT